MDAESVKVLEKLSLPRAIVVPHEEFATQALEATRERRSMAEYCWTSKPVVLLHALGIAQSSWDWVIYLDSDMMLFGNANLVLSHTPIDFLITPHRFSQRFVSFEKNVGLYNAGYAGFRNSSLGRRALDWWMNRCLEWCGSVPVAGKYADQKYLDELPQVFEVKVPTFEGLNVAPWNVGNYIVRKNSGSVYMDDKQLLLYHFQGLRIHGTALFDMYAADMKLAPEVVRHIYHPYLRGLRRAFAKLRSVDPEFRYGIAPLSRYPKNVLHQMKAFLLGRCNLRLVLTDYR
jgi:glycosyltransferase involved in cell wall biosynthesis